jgi:hypothetical protein
VDQEVQNRLGTQTEERRSRLQTEKGQEKEVFDHADP